jgi:hypothetical protein
MISKHSFGCHPANPASPSLTSEKRPNNPVVEDGGMNPSSSVPCSPESTRLRNKHCYSRVSPGRHLISLAYPPRIRSASGAMGVKLDCSHELFVLLSTRTAAVHRNRTEDSLISRCVRPLCRVPLSVKEPANPACGRKWEKNGVVGCR